jgi:hypothetical protein
MMRWSKVLFGFFVIGGAALGLLILMREDQPQQPQQEISALKAELASLRGAMQEQAGALRRVAHHRVAASVLAPSHEPSLPPVAEGSPGTSAEAEERARGQRDASRLTYEQSRVRVLEAYSDEAVDSVWSARVTDKLGAAVRNRLPGGSRLTSLECRTTMCQLKIVHTDPRAHGQFLMDGFMDWPGSVFVAGEEQDRGGLAVTLIAAREGTEPPIAPR